MMQRALFVFHGQWSGTAGGRILLFLKLPTVVTECCGSRVLRVCEYFEQYF